MPAFTAAWPLTSPRTCSSSFRSRASTNKQQRSRDPSRRVRNDPGNARTGIIHSTCRRSCSAIALPPYVSLGTNPDRTKKTAWAND
jgi:hypothetical protein